MGWGFRDRCHSPCIDAIIVPYIGRSPQSLTVQGLDIIYTMFGKLIPITDRIFQIHAMGARVTVVVEDGGVLLVDAGLPGSGGAISRGLDALDLSLEHVRCVAITHAHPDHAGGLAEIVDGRDLAVAAHRLDADVIEGREPPPNPVRYRLASKLADPFHGKLMGSPARVTHRLEDGDTIPFAADARAVHLPGHTDGSMAIYLPTERAIIVGDALQYRFTFPRKLGAPSRVFTRDPEQAIRSLERLLDLDFDLICFGHFPPMRDAPHDALQAMLEGARTD